MTCAEAERLLDSFVDAELPGPMLLEVARHAGSCSTCDRAVREMTALRSSLEQMVRGELEGIDLSGVWPAVEQRIVRSDRRGVWGRVPRRLPMWGAAAAAIAAGALLWFRTPPPEPVRVTHARPNQAVIERLVSSQGSRVGIMKDRKYGTTLIMVSAPGEDAGQ
jgi:anti-sigma factor RsiW